MYSFRALRGDDPVGMCHDPSMKMFLEGGLLLLFLCASMACGMETRLLLELEVNDDDAIAIILVLVEEMDCLNLVAVGADDNMVRVRVNL